jgi:putative redox protein
VFSGIRLRHVIRGRGVEPAAVAQAVELSFRKYCSVGAMLSSAVPIDHAFEVVEEPDPRADLSKPRPASGAAVS